MVALFHVFSRLRREKRRVSRLKPTGKGLQVAFRRPGSLGPFWPKTPSGKGFAFALRPFGVNLSKLVNWLHSRVFGHFQKLALGRLFQKPRLASVLRIFKIRPLHLTTFDQKPPEPKMPFGDGLRRRRSEAASKGRRRSGARRLRRLKSRRDGGFWGNFS